MSGFVALVDLCRLARERAIAGTDLILRLTRISQSVALVDAIESDGWDTTLRRDGRTLVAPFDRLEEAQEVELIVHGMARDNEVIANNVGMLLKYNLGTFLGRTPQKYYLLQENHASWEKTCHPDVLAYHRAIRVTDLIKRLADVVKERAETAGEAIILTTRKLAIPLAYDSQALSNVAPDAEIDRFEATTFNEHHAAARLDIAKRVLVRSLASAPEADRFSQLLKRLPQLVQTILADFDLYISGFNFDKAREEFERKKIDFVVKINSAGSDAMNKLLAIPIGQGLLVSQMKTDPAYTVVNQTLLSASMIFAIIAAILLISHALTLRQIGGELKTEKDLLESRAPPTFRQLQPMIGDLQSKIKLFQWAVPIALGALLLVTTLITVFAYSRLTP